MAIGTAAAIGLGVAGVGSVLSAKSNKAAANKAADTSLAVAQQNNALARDIYGQNKDVMNPFVTRGNQAGSAINALLGFDSPQQQQPAAMAPQNYAFGSPYAVQEQGIPSNFGYGDDSPFSFAYPSTVTTPGYGGPLNNGVNQETAENAFARYRDSTGYNFRFDEGMNALNTGFAGNGVLRSGAATKAALKYGQDYGSNEFGNYLGYLSNQQGVGLSAGSALAGVGQNYVNNVSANNNSAGTAAANAALFKGQANSNMFSSIAGALGGALGSSYG